MPFKKVGKNDYTSPSGRHYNSAQVRLWYAGGGKFPGEKGPGEMAKKYAKGGDIGVGSYAAGGPVLGRTRDFMKEPDQFDGGRMPPKNPTATPQEYGSKGGYAPKDKSLKPVKPRG